MKNYTWNLDILYTGFSDPAYSEDMSALSEAIKDFSAFSKAAPDLSHKEVILGYVERSERISELVSKLALYANLAMSVNTADSEAASAYGKVMSQISALSAPEASLRKIIASYDDLETIIDSDKKLAEFRYLLTSIKKNSIYLLNDGEEAVFSKMNLSGASAWSDLQSNLTSSLKGSLNGEEYTLSQLRNMAYSPDPDTRKAAYDAELASYDKIKDAVAFALNSIKLQVISECELRGYSSPLHKALCDSRMEAPTLDALISAMEDYLPHFRRYLRAKAKLVSGKERLDWWDLFAPIGSSDLSFTPESCAEYLLDIFKEFDSDLHDMVKEAFENRWIDFYPREGKVGGAFDCGVPSAKQSRVLTNFDGSLSDVVTLAHELGHSFHDRQVFDNSILNQEYTMPVAETASTFNEVLVMNKAIQRAKTTEEKLALIESQLSDLNQIIVDIYSRFLFERSVFDKRNDEFMSADRFCELMTEAQIAAYGDGLERSTLHPYMWLCKGHYYSGGLSFYNFPYAFGGLFARGLYAKYEKEGKDFLPTYKAMLKATGTCSVEDAAKVADIDVTKKEFWQSGLETAKKQIDLFEELVEKVKKA